VRLRTQAQDLQRSLVQARKPVSPVAYRAKPGHPLLDLQRTIGNQAVLGLLQARHHSSEVASRGPHSAQPKGCTRKPDKGTPDPGKQAPKPERPKSSAGNCSVASGPSYSPSRTIPVTDYGSFKTASFNMAATLTTDSAKNSKPSCCEIRQFIRWDKTAHKANGGPPHEGFPSSAKADTWIEDRTRDDKRYGHRSGPHSDLSDDCYNKYTTGKTRDDSNGNTYCGSDNPSVHPDMKGQYQFRLDVVDTCNKDATKASSSVITVDWSK